MKYIADATIFTGGEKIYYWWMIKNTGEISLFSGNVWKAIEKFFPVYTNSTGYIFILPAPCTSLLVVLFAIRGMLYSIPVSSKQHHLD
jgi:hypothetical protein